MKLLKPQKYSQIFILFSLIVIFFFLSSYGFAQRSSLPIVAVTSIEAVDVPAAVANACREMVETALIKTGKYQVMNYTNMKEVLEAQSFFSFRLYR